MSLLAELVRAYDARSDMPPLNYSAENVGFLIPLEENGELSGPPQDLRRANKKAPTPRTIFVPSPAKRTSAVIPNFLWDKTSYALGISRTWTSRTEVEHEKFVQWHTELLSQTTDSGLRAFLCFLLNWTTTRFTTLGWPKEMLDQNVIFGLETERDEHGLPLGIHQRPAAQELWAKIQASRQGNFGACAITGVRGPIARLHPPIKGVPGAQASGALLVSFNLDAFCSYDRVQGDNAPITEAAAFKYGTVLNRLLGYGSRNKIQLGDLTLIFWATGPEKTAVEAEEIFSALLEDGDPSKYLKLDRTGDCSLAELRPDLCEIPFSVAGLSSNAARLSVRFHLTTVFDQVLARIIDHYCLTQIQHSAATRWISMKALLTATAFLGQEDHIAASVATHLVRAALTGEPYPDELLRRTVMRLQSDKQTSVGRAALLKAILSRNYGIHLGYSLTTEITHRPYLLGRLLAWLDFLEQEARGGGLSTPVSSVHYAAASAHPTRTFPALYQKAVRNIQKIRPRRPALATYATACLQELVAMTPLSDTRNDCLTLEERAVFAIGCYHQRQELYLSRERCAHRVDQEF